MKRSEAIRKMCRLGGVRPGATDAEIRGIYGEYMDVLIGADIDAEIVLKRALGLLPPTRPADAIKNALINDDQSTLGQRRERFMAAHDLSLRTVVRDEDEGAELLVHYIDRVLEYLSSTGLTTKNLILFDKAVAIEGWRLTQQVAAKRGVSIEQVLSERISRIAQDVQANDLEYLLGELRAGD